MRVITSAVVVSSLLLAAAAGAGTGTSTKTKAKAGAGSGSAAAGSAATPAPVAAGSAGSAAGSGSAEPTIDPATVKPEDMPTAVRMRRLEQKTQALKERAWQLKARVQMLKEQVLGGGVGAQSMIAHSNEMGSSFRLVALVYSLDGTQVFVRTDDTGESLYKTKSFDVFSGPISPGNHNLTVLATYRGHGYGVFEYLSKYTFNAKATSTFTAGEGKISKVACKGYEKGGAATPMEKRPAIDCKVTEVAPEKAPEATAPTAPGTTPMPASTAGSAATPAPTPGK